MGAELEGVRPRDLWTGLVIDPLAAPLARFLASRSWITPNRVTLLAGVFAVASATSFGLGAYRIGGVLFLVRFLFDCVDGMVARLQGSGSRRGALLDVTTDVLGIGLVLAAMSWRLLQDGAVPDALPLVVITLVGFFSWIILYRKGLEAATDGRPTRAAPEQAVPAVPVLGWWLTWSRKRNLMPVPYSVEAETVMLGLSPIIGGVTGAVVGIWVGAVFYTMAGLLNVWRAWRIAGATDA